MQNIQNRYRVSRSWVPGAGFPTAAFEQHQSRTGLSSRQELDSGMHGLESGSGSQVEQARPFQKMAVDEDSETLMIPQL